MIIIIKEAGVAITLETSVREVVGSNLDRHTGHPDTFHVGFISASRQMSRLYVHQVTAACF
jgi:hypothetical protein